LVNRHKSQPYSLYLSSLLTLPGVIPPTGSKLELPRLALASFAKS
jgi:hypothetical protein